MDGQWATDGTPEDGRCVVHVDGELDLETGPPLREHLAGVLTRCAVLVVDLTDVAFCDSSGLGALVATRRRAALLDRGLVLRVTPDSRMHRILRLSGLDESFVLDLGEAALPH